MWVSILFLSVFSVQTASATEACGRPLCPAFTEYFFVKSKIKEVEPTLQDKYLPLGGYFQAISWCAREQCNPNLVQETGEYGCYFFNGRKYGDTHQAQNWSCLKKPSSMSGLNPNCNIIWRDWDQGRIDAMPGSVTLSFQHPCNKNIVGCEVTVYKDGRENTRVEKHIGREKEKKNPGLLDCNMNYKPSRGPKKPKNVENNPSGKSKQGESLPTTVVTTTIKVDGSKQGLGEDLLKKKDSAKEEVKEGTETGENTPAGLDQKTEAASQPTFQGASRIPSDSSARFGGRPVPDLKKQMDCENNKFDPGPISDGKKLYIGRDYQFVYTGKRQRGYECIGTSNIEEPDSVTKLCQAPPAQALQFFEELKDGRKGCTGVSGGMTTVILDRDSPQT